MKFLHKTQHNSNLINIRTDSELFCVLTFLFLTERTSTRALVLDLDSWVMVN